jgi:hypothetical protein
MAKVFACRGSTFDRSTAQCLLNSGVSRVKEVPMFVMIPVVSFTYEDGHTVENGIQDQLVSVLDVSRVVPRSDGYVNIHLRTQRMIGEISIPDTLTTKSSFQSVVDALSAGAINLTGNDQGVPYAS